MGIYIKGVELPTSCHSCPHEIGGDCYGGKAKYIKDVDDNEEQFRNSRHPNCPLIHVQEPHGRLIDADELKYYGVHIGDEYEDRFHDYQRVDRSDIDNAPTVIEGSE